MRKYPKYKYSGLEWIGEIPEEWNTIKICYVFSPVSIKNTSGEINLSVYRDYGVIPTSSRDDNHNVVSEDTSSYKLVQIGDFVMNKMKCWMGSLGLSSYRGIVSPSYTVMKPLTKDNSKFLHYLLRSPIYIPQYRRLSYGVREGQWDLRFEDFRELPCLLPPLTEQQQIVTYLDQKTTIIDQIISNSEKKIEMLREQRTSIINHTVTKGLNPKVKMKDSGVEWIGEIPAGWECRLGTTIGCFFKGKGIKKDEVVDSGNPCIRYGEIYTKYNHKVDSVHSFINDDVSNTSLKIKGTHILLTGSGELSTEIGKAIVITLEEVFIGGDIIILKSGNDFDPFYLTYLINSECVRIQREISAKGEIIVHIYPKNFREMRFCCPPLTEQQQIVTFLDQRTKEIDELILIEKRRVDRLKEYRQSLISEVVTGKIKVTND